MYIHTSTEASMANQKPQIRDTAHLVELIEGQKIPEYLITGYEIDIESTLSLALNPNMFRRTCLIFGCVLIALVMVYAVIHESVPGGREYFISILEHSF